MQLQRTPGARLSPLKNSIGKLNEVVDGRESCIYLREGYGSLDGLEEFVFAVSSF